MKSALGCSRCGLRLDRDKLVLPCAPGEQPVLPPDAARYAAGHSVAFTGWLHNYTHGTHGNCYRVVVAENALLQLSAPTAHETARRGRSASGLYRPPEAQTRTQGCAAPSPRHADRHARSHAHRPPPPA